MQGGSRHSLALPPLPCRSPLCPSPSPSESMVMGVGSSSATAPSCSRSRLAPSCSRSMGICLWTMGIVSCWGWRSSTPATAPCCSQSRASTPRLRLLLLELGAVLHLDRPLILEFRLLDSLRAAFCWWLAGAVNARSPRPAPSPLTSPLRSCTISSGLPLRVTLGMRNS